MSRIVVAALLTVACVGMAISPARAAGNGSHSEQQTYWKQQDTAVYVVSTLNLLRHDHTAFVTLATQKLKVARFAVYEDLDSTNVYFINLLRADGSRVGTLTYVMGWQLPRSLSSSLNKYGVHAAPDYLVTAYKTDSKRLMETFKTSLPS